MDLQSNIKNQNDSEHKHQEVFVKLNYTGMINAFTYIKYLNIAKNIFPPPSLLPLMHHTWPLFFSVFQLFV